MICTCSMDTKQSEALYSGDVSCPYFTKSMTMGVVGPKFLPVMLITYEQVEDMRPKINPLLR